MLCSARPLSLLSFPTLVASSALCAQADPLAPLGLVEATVPQLRGAIESGLLTAEGLASRYLARVQAYDAVGPVLTSVLRINPDLIA